MFLNRKYLAHLIAAVAFVPFSTSVAALESSEIAELCINKGIASVSDARFIALGRRTTKNSKKPFEYLAYEIELPAKTSVADREKVVATARGCLKEYGHDKAVFLDHFPPLFGWTGEIRILLGVMIK